MANGVCKSTRFLCLFLPQCHYYVYQSILSALSCRMLDKGSIPNLIVFSLSPHLNTTTFLQNLSYQRRYYPKFTFETILQQLLNSHGSYPATGLSGRSKSPHGGGWYIWHRRLASRRSSLSSCIRYRSRQRLPPLRPSTQKEAYGLARGLPSSLAL